MLEHEFEMDSTARQAFDAAVTLYVGDTFTCPTCFATTYVTDEDLCGYCLICMSFTGIPRQRSGEVTPTCGTCQQAKPLWWVQDEIWQSVMGDLHTSICPTCFIARAQSMGVGTQRGSWQLYPPAQLS